MMGFFASATFVAALVGACPEMPQWESDYGRALEATRSSGRPLLIVLDMPNEAKGNLKPIRMSEGRVAGSDTCLLIPYQLCHVDVSTEYGKKVAKVFRTSRFPFVAIIDKMGESIIFKKTGKMTDSEWQATLVKHKDGELKAVRVADYGSSRYQSMMDPNYCPSCQNGGW